MPENADPQSLLQPPSGTILVVDDDPDTRENLKQLLLERGHAVRLAADGGEALALLGSPPLPDLILLDLVLPGVDGWEFRRRQLAHPDLARVPVVILSAVGEPDATLGDVGYLHKPVDPTEVFAVLGRFLGTRKPTVLVAEDEPAVLRMLEVALQHYGFAVLAARGGRQAVELYQKHIWEVDILLLDVQMPGLDGPGALAAIRGLAPSVPCVFMSGNTGRYTAEQLFALGASRVLPKPFSRLNDLMRALHEVIAWA
jgi:CheY-like chemotaxis protein